jgi:hypothetical protein
MVISLLLVILVHGHFLAAYIYVFNQIHMKCYFCEDTWDSKDSTFYSTRNSFNCVYQMDNLVLL